MSYTPPGVTITETLNPVVSVSLASTGNLCLIGMTAGVIVVTDTITLSGTTAVTLPSAPSDSTMTVDSITSVMDADPTIASGDYDNTTGYVADTYTFDQTAHTIVRVADPEGPAPIPDGNVVYVTYSYTPVDYFRAITTDSMAAIEGRFGTQYDESGTVINSPLSYAAQIAFENGASTLILQPLFFNNAGILQQPNDAQAAAASTWQDNLTALRGVENIGIVVPVVGQSQTSVGDSNVLGIAQAVQDFVYYQANSNNSYAFGLFGEDSSSSNTVAQRATLITHAQTLESRYGGSVNEQMLMVSPSNFSRRIPGSSNGTITVGGQYVAAAVGGAIVSRPVASTLTRKAISGFYAVNDVRTSADKNTDAGNGMMVIEQVNGLIRVRHAITMDTTGVQRRELSVVRAKHLVIQSVRDMLDTQIIGQIVADAKATTVVGTAVSGVLELLRGDGDIITFSDISTRLLTLDPTTIEVRFSYLPAFPINYIDVGFSLDLTNSTISDTVTTTSSSS